MNSQIEQINSISEQLQTLQATTISFIQKWLYNYELVYQLIELEGKSALDSDYKHKIWKATEEQINSDYTERLRNLLDPLKIPCPIERPQQFRNYILDNLKRLGKTEKQKIKELKAL